MSDIATHSIRFFDTVYGASKGSYIDGCVDIGIHMASTIVALKVLVGSFANMFTYIAGLTGESRVNNDYRDALKKPLVLQKGAKLPKRPPSKFGSKFFVSSFGGKPNVGQILYGDPLAILFGRKDDGFCNGMIHNACMGSFFAPEPFGQPPTVSLGGTFRGVCLCANGTPNLLPMLTVLVKPIGRMLNTVRGHNDIRDSKIATYKINHAFASFPANFYGLTEEKFSLFVNQVGFSLDKRDMFRLVANKINFLSAANTPQRNHMVWFVGHNSGIISDGTKRFEFPFCFLVQAIGIGNLGNRSYKH